LAFALTSSFFGTFEGFFLYLFLLVTRQLGFNQYSYIQYSPTNYYLYIFIGDFKNLGQKKEQQGSRNPAALLAALVITLTACYDNAYD